MHTRKTFSKTKDIIIMLVLKMGSLELWLHFVGTVGTVYIKNKQENILVSITNGLNTFCKFRD